MHCQELKSQKSAIGNCNSLGISPAIQIALTSMNASVFVETTICKWTMITSIRIIVSGLALLPELGDISQACFE